VTAPLAPVTWTTLVVPLKTEMYWAVGALRLYVAVAPLLETSVAVTGMFPPS
jgi:hypothetical protein